MGDLIGGYNNHLVITLGYQGDITGNHGSRAVSGMQFYLPMSARLTHICGSVSAIGTGGAATVNVLAGGAKVSSAGLSFSSGVLSGSNAAIKSSYILSAAGTIFSLCEHTTTVALSNLSVQLWFRPQVD